MTLVGDGWDGMITMPVWWVYAGMVGWTLLLLVVFWVTATMYARRRDRAEYVIRATPSDSAEQEAELATDVEDEQRWRERFDRSEPDLFTQAAASAHPNADPDADPEAPLAFEEWRQWWQVNPPSRRWARDPSATPSTRQRWVRDWAMATRPPNPAVQQELRNVGLSTAAEPVDTVHDRTDQLPVQSREDG